MTDPFEPSQSQAVTGHDSAKEQIAQAFKSGRMHHAWLLTGPQGIGKATLAYHAAHMILSGGANSFEHFDPENQAARLVRAGSHPDFFVLQRLRDEKTDLRRAMISVEQARSLAPFLTMTSVYSFGRVALLDEVHTMNVNGQNAILKLIEEPPSHTVLFLTATTAGALLPTIRSRCRLLPLEPLSAGQVKTILTRLDPNALEGVDAEKLLRFAGGSAGRALSLLQTKALDLFEELLNILKPMPALDMARLHALADKLARKEQGAAFEALSTLFLEALSDSITSMAQERENRFGFFFACPLDRAMEAWEDVSGIFSAAKTGNLDSRLAFIHALTTLSQKMKEQA
ncbi:MAG: DNA polymerase III subunit delta' [Alphaproteobacteria bacterium]|nr:DNA polymerase III subunit delta' [Alphaproteobacteria bacterium]